MTRAYEGGGRAGSRLRPTAPWGHGYATRDRRPWLAALLCLLALALCGPAAGAEERLGRTRTALEELARLVAQAAPRGHATPYHRIPLVLGRQALAALDGAPAAHRPRILDHLYEASLRAMIAIHKNIGEDRAPRPRPPLRLADLQLREGAFVSGDEAVFPVAASDAGDATGFFAQGGLVRAVPALAGVAPEGLEGSAVLAVYEAVAGSRRVGWDRPAGGFVRDGSEGTPPVLIAIDHPAMREAIARDTAAALEAWPQDARPLYISMGGGPFYTDFSERSAQRFAAWLRDRYATVRTLNAVWGTDFQAIGPDLMPTPDQAGASPARWYDWVRFNEDRFTEHVGWARANLRGLRPGTPVGLAATRCLLAGSRGLSGIDPVGLAEALDVVEARGADPLHTDLAAAVAGGAKPVADPQAQARGFGILPHLVHGAAAVGIERWPPAPLHTLEAVRAAERVLREALDARHLAEPIAALARAPAGVGLLYSQASVRQAPAWALRCARTPHTRELERAYRAARFLDAGCRFVVARGRERRSVPAVPVLVVAGAPHEGDAVVRALVERVELGSHLVVIAESLVADERGREADYLLRLGIEVLETRRPSYATRPRPERGGALDELVVAEAPRAVIAPAPGGPLASLGPLRGVGVRQSIRVNVRHADLAAFPDGTPAIVSFARGRGRVTYLAMPLEERHLAGVLRFALAERGAAPPVRLLADARGRPGVECRSVRDGDRVLAYAWNASARARRVVLAGPPAAGAADLSSGEPLPVSENRPGVVGPLSLAPWQSRLVAIRVAPRPAPPE
ncbi:MAG: beta-galactosidase [Candidatus Brocadiia bacterium]